MSRISFFRSMLSDVEARAEISTRADVLSELLLEVDAKDDIIADLHELADKLDQRLDVSRDEIEALKAELAAIYRLHDFAIAERDGLKAQVVALQALKDYAHSRMDELGVPHEMPSPHTDAVMPDRRTVSNVIPFGGITRLDIGPERVLSAAAGKLEGVVLLGYDKDGDEYFASSYADGGEVLWLMEKLKTKLMAVTSSGEG